MPEYGNMDIAIPGLQVEGIQSVSSIRSRVAKQAIDFGNPVMGYLGDEVSSYNYALDTSKIVWDADFVTGNTIEIVVNGQSTGLIPFNSTHNDTMDDVLAAVTALTITDSVLGTVGVDASLDGAAAPNRTLYIRAKGLDLTVTEEVLSGASQATGTITYQTDQVFIGVAFFVQKDIAVAGAGGFRVDQSVSVMERGIVWVNVNAPTVADDDAYIDNAGGDKGVFAAAGDTINCKFRSNNTTNSTTSDVIAKLEARGIYKPNAEIVWS